MQLVVAELCKLRSQGARFDALWDLAKVRTGETDCRVSPYSFASDAHVSFWAAVVNGSLATTIFKCDDVAKVGRDYVRVSTLPADQRLSMAVFGVHNKPVSAALARTSELLGGAV